MYNVWELDHVGRGTMTNEGDGEDGATASLRRMEL